MRQLRSHESNEHHFHNFHSFKNFCLDVLSALSPRCWPIDSCVARVSLFPWIWRRIKAPEEDSVWAAAWGGQGKLMGKTARNARTVSGFQCTKKSKNGKHGKRFEKHGTNFNFFEMCQTQGMHKHLEPRNIQAKKVICSHFVPREGATKCKKEHCEPWRWFS